MLNADARRVGRYRQDLLCRCRQLRDGLACAGRVHRDVYGAGVGRAISIGHVKSAGQWCEMLRATRVTGTGTPYAGAGTGCRGCRRRSDPTGNAGRTASRTSRSGRSAQDAGESDRRDGNGSRDGTVRGECPIRGRDRRTRMGGDRGDGGVGGAVGTGLMGAPGASEMRASGG